MSEWINVGEAIPDSDTDVIVATEDGHVEAGYYDGIDWRWLGAGVVQIGVTHWMSFPNPPEEAK
jgi:hypothetical protein